MENTFGSNLKICATCDYWVGNRTPKMGGFSVCRSESGKCYVIHPNGVDKKAMYTCNLWKKWGALH